MVFGFIAVAGAEIAALATNVGLEVSSMGGDNIDDLVAKDNAANRENAAQAQREYVAHAQQHQGPANTTMIVSLLSACSVVVCCMMVASMMMLSVSND